MIPTNLRGEDVFLLPYLANWAAEKPALTLEANASITRSLGGIESRETAAHTLRATSFKCSLFLRADESAAFRAALRQLGSTRVLMPLWPLAHRLVDGRIIYTDAAGNILTAPDGAIYIAGVNLAAPSPVQTSLWLTMERDLSLWEVHEDPLPEQLASFSERALRVPLLLGVLKKLPDPVALNRNLLGASIEFEDTAPAIFAPRSADDTAEEIDGAGRPVFPFAPNWADEVRAGGVSYEIEREQIGEGRTPATTYYPQPHARVLQAQFNTFSHAELARLVAFFHRRRGPVELFAVNHPHDGPIVARFAKKTLDLTFANGRITHTRIDFLELPHEAAPPVGETPGVTMGALPRRAQLFRFTYGLGTQQVVYRCTGYERNLVAAGELYLAQKIEHGDITESLEPEQTKVKLTASAWEGNPLMLLDPPRLEGPLKLEILRCSPDENGLAETAQLRFAGRVGKPNFDGPKITCEVAHLLADLQNNVPDMIVQADCNLEFGSLVCGVLLSTWTFTGAVAAYDGAALALTGVVRAGGAAMELAAGWFARGRVEFGDGDGFQSRSILSSTALAGGSLTLTLSQPFDLPPAGTVKFYPACDGSPSRCQVFQNFQRYGGFPFVPVGNPALKPIKKDTSQGKK
ncbi:phage BR0599 family protein [Termitidicoccus mucosus]|uniref:Bacteriophage phiJL001 Gp84 C-terminal domain-containing protein n=1 Tax=Termitidicoccus mucosus TaxID=1184151 RepID=A0A178IH82_9BACT|nr:hypothetical protein AW736_13960 [Opitutaceae bacterium TSB47]